MALDYAELFLDGHMPSPGGALDQVNWFLQFARLVRHEYEHWKAVTGAYGYGK